MQNDPSQIILNRRDFLRRAGMAAIVLATGSPGYSNENTRQKSRIRKPNILLIVSDDQGWGDAGCYWKKTDIETPVMDEIARTGIRFRQFYVNPLCAPTRSAFMTGQYSMENGMWRGPSAANESERCIKADVTILPEFLIKAGYRTGIFGKWHLGYQAPNTPNERGFDEFYGFLGGAHPYIPGHASRLMHNDRSYSEDMHLTDYFTEKAINFIKYCAERTQPFFCYVPYNAVHGPLWRKEQPKPSGKVDWLTHYADRGVGLPRRDYNAVLGHMDRSVGRLLELLKELKIQENTLVIYFSDNGACLESDETKANYPGNNGPLRSGKGSTYEGGIRVPCVMRWKGRFPEGLVSDDLVMHFDIFSTILNAAGLAIPKVNGRNPVHGISLMKYITSGCREALPARTVFWELTGKVAIRSGRWKLVGSVENPRAQWDKLANELTNTDLELYDIQTDIGETRNLKDKNPDEYSHLKEELIKFFRNIK